MTIDSVFIHTFLGWVCQGFITVGMMVLAAKMGLFPYLLFQVGKPPTDGSNTPKAA